MNKTANPSSNGTHRESVQPAPDEIRAQLRTILHSSSFEGSRRCRQFLEYACERALEGDAGALKERAIAVHVFGRRPETALGEDTIVRVGAREVRKRLAQFYVSTEGALARVHIDLSPGSYVPEFSYASEAGSPVLRDESGEHVQESETEALPGSTGTKIDPPVPSPASKPAMHSKVALWCAATVVVIIIAVFLIRLAPRGNANAEPFRRFWDPVFRSGDPLVIGVGHPIVYQPSQRITLLNAQRAAPAPYPMQQKIELPPDEIDGSEMVAVQNQFVGFGDLVAANEATRMLARRGRDARVALASSLSFADLRGSNAYLIGSLTNHWTMELSQNWPFQFGWTGNRDAAIRDTTSRAARQWIVLSNGDGSTPEDYSIIARVRDSPTGGLLIVAAGLKQFGTEAAARIIANPQEFGPILAKLPTGWDNRNLEIVIHVRVIGNSPAKPELTAWRVW